MVVNWDWVDDHAHNPHLFCHKLSVLPHHLYHNTICITTLFQHPSMLYFLMTIIVTIAIIIICSITSTEFQRPSMTMVYPNMRMYPPTISQASENIASELPSKSKSLSYKNKFIINTHLKDHSIHQHIIIKL